MNDLLLIDWLFWSKCLQSFIVRINDNNLNLDWSFFAFFFVVHVENSSSFSIVVNTRFDRIFCFHIIFLKYFSSLSFIWCDSKTFDKQWWCRKSICLIWCCHCFLQIDFDVNIIIVIFIVVVIVRNVISKLYYRLYFNLIFLFHFERRVLYESFVDNFMIHIFFSWLFENKQIEFLFKCDNEFVVRLLLYWYIRSKNKINILNDNDIKKFLQVLLNYDNNVVIYQQCHNYD